MGRFRRCRAWDGTDQTNWRDGGIDGGGGKGGGEVRRGSEAWRKG